MDLKNRVSFVLATFGLIFVTANAAGAVGPAVSGNVSIGVTVSASISMKIHSNNDQVSGEATYGFIDYKPVGSKGATDDEPVEGPSQANALVLEGSQRDLSTLYSEIEVRSTTGKFKLEVQDADDDNNLNLSTKSSTVGEYIPAIEGEPSANTASWAISGGSMTGWKAMPRSIDTPLVVLATGTNGTDPVTYSAKTTITYGIATGVTKTGVYSDTITYTATALDDADPVPEEIDSSTPAFYTISNMQQMTRAICQDERVVTPTAGATTKITRDNWESETDGIPTITLADNRGGVTKTYTVKKLADGNCWMTDNLDLPAGATITSEDSDLDGTIVSSYTLPTSTRTSSTDPDSETVHSEWAAETDGTNGGKYGSYYSWRVATAGTGRGSSDYSATITDVYGNDMKAWGAKTVASICPKGWRLPTGGNTESGTPGESAPGSTNGVLNGDFQRLYDAYNNKEYMVGGSYGPTLVKAGAALSSGRYNQEQMGMYWSATNSSVNSASGLGINDSGVYAGTADGKNVGYSVRCIAR